MNIKQQIAHLTELSNAIDNGEVVERRRNKYAHWCEYTGISFPLHEYQYRVKPEPMVVYVNYYADTSISAHRDKDLALTRASQATRALIKTAVKFIEAENQD